MERRYQVFISSTFTDLIEERKAIIEGLLQMDCLPAGMELFPAGNEDQWTLIKGVIDASDYYLVVVGGRYGSTTAEGISYTEKEYDYALERGIPVMGFVPADPGSIPKDKLDLSEEAQEKLTLFQAKVQQKITKSYASPADLQAQVIVGLTHLQKKFDRPGWVRGDLAMTEEIRTQIAELQAALASAEADKIRQSTQSVSSMDTSFEHGDDEIVVDLYYSGYGSATGRVREDALLSLTWDNVFELMGPFMIDEAPEPQLRRRLNDFLLSAYVSLKGYRHSSSEAAISNGSWGTILVQLRALRLIANGKKKRTVSDKAVYWRLTEAGDAYLVGLLATKRTIIDHSPSSPTTKESTH